MRKLAVKIEPGYTQVSNAVFDDPNLCIVDMGLLGKLLRCQDGFDVTVQGIADRHADPSRRGTGYAALEASMRNLVQRGYVVKIKYQDDAGHWRTAFAPFNRPAGPSHVTAMLDAIDDTVRAYKVEPAHLDTRVPDSPPDQGECPFPGIDATDSALSGSRLAGDRSEPSYKEDVVDNTKDQNTPPSLPSVERPTARERDAEAGREGQGTGSPTSSRKRTTPAAPSAGVTLLVDIGRTHPQIAFAGPWLASQGARIDTLLGAGWTPEQLTVLLTWSLPDQVDRPAGFVRSRIDDIPAAPVRLATLPEQRDAGDDPWGEPSGATAADRTPAEAVRRRVSHECPGDAGMCGRPVDVAGMLCPRCAEGEL